MFRAERKEVGAGNCVGVLHLCELTSCQWGDLSIPTTSKNRNRHRATSRVSRLSREEPNQPHDSAEQQTDQDARQEGDVDPDILPLDANVAWQFAERRNRRSQQPNDADPEDDQTDANHQSCRILRHFLLPVSFFAFDLSFRIFAPFGFAPA